VQLTPTEAARLPRGDTLRTPVYITQVRTWGSSALHRTKQGDLCCTQSQDERHACSSHVSLHAPAYCQLARPEECRACL
jgi:hypothetical protein